METVTPLDVILADYAPRGWLVLPLHGWTGTACTCGNADCSSPAKHPRTRNGLKDASSDVERIRSWWGRWPDANVGLRTGEHFDVLDVDGDDGFDSIAAMEQARGPVAIGPTSMTGGGGAHRLFSPTGGGNRAGLLEHVDWRGKGGYIVGPPSLHRSGRRYTWAEELGPRTNLPAVEGWLLDLLFPKPPAPRAGKSTITTRRAGDPYSPYAQRALDAELEELGRAVTGTRNHTLNTVAFNLLQLAYGGDLDVGHVTQVVTDTAIRIGLGGREVAGTVASADKAARGSPRSAPQLAVVGTAALAPHPLEPQEEPDDSSPDDTAADPVTTWEPVDIAAVLQSIKDGTDLSPPPTLYPRSDGACLLYAGKVHAFNGEPESGKSWAAQHATAVALMAGENVTYIDFEDDEASVIGRLLLLGVTEDALLAHLAYIRPSRPFNNDAVDTLRHAFTDRRPALVILDGLTEAMANDNLDPLDNIDVAKFFVRLPKRIAAMGAAVVIIDHVTKDSESRGRWAIGAQHKLAALNGAAYTFETLLPFGRGKHGITKVTVTKDRPGHVRQHAAGSTVAELHLTSTDAGVTAELRSPGGGTDDEAPFRPTRVMERVSKALEGQPARNLRNLRTEVRGNAGVVDLAVEQLVNGGYVGVHKQGQAKYHHSIKPFREDDENA